MAEDVALITGVTGQDGAYLADLLLSKNYRVHGVKRRSSSLNTGRVDHLYVDPHLGHTRFFLHFGDVTDSTNLIRLIQETQPTEIYNLAAQSHVQVSFETAEYTANADALGTLRLLEAIRILRLENKVRFYQASTSELYGKVQQVPQKETTPFYPRSPYGAAKLYAYWITVNYREAYGIHASNGILFNHESPLRGETFVTRKVTRAVAAIAHGLQKKLYVGNLDARRDWGHARDYVEGMWMIVQQEQPDDYVLATGEDHSVRELIELAFSVVGLEIGWRGEGNEEVGFDRRTQEVLIEIDPQYFRRTEVDQLVGDPTKARTKLGWKHRVGFDELVKEMVMNDMTLVETQHERLNMAQPRSSFGLSGRRVWVAGHRGMVGSAVVRRLEVENCEILTVDRKEVDLRRQADVGGWMAAQKPEVVILAAATVGGILANNARPAEFLYDNLAIETNIIEAAYRTNVAKLLFLGSSCIYPRLAPQPMREDALLTGPLEPTNQWYAIAKITGIMLCRAYRRQYGCDFISAMPTNLYGGGDNFDLASSHVIPALIAKADAAKRDKANKLTVWGTGTPRREFMYVDDLADALIFLIEHYTGEDHVNVGVGYDLTIRELAEIIARIVGFEGRMVFDASRPDGTPRKLMDSSVLLEMGWRPKTDFESGLNKTYQWYLHHALDASSRA